MNKIILCGYLGKDPEVRYTNDKLAVCRFSLAVQRKYAKEGEKKADWFRCIAFGKTAETISKFCKKGSHILVDGRVQTGTYEDQEGVTRVLFDVVTESFEFAESKKESNGSQGYAPQGTRGTDPCYPYEAFDVDEEDLPF